MGKSCCRVVPGNFEEYCVIDCANVQATIYGGAVSDKLWNAEKANSASAWLREITLQLCFIDGVTDVCKMLPINPSTEYPYQIGKVLSAFP